MTPEQAMDRINIVLAHAWMVRTFLKHADEVQGDTEMLEVHRMIFDYCRAVEPSYQRRDATEYSCLVAVGVKQIWPGAVKGSEKSCERAIKMVNGGSNSG